MALWIIENAEYPYNSCRTNVIFERCEPKISWAIRTAMNSKQHQNTARSIIDLAVSKNYDVNEISEFDGASAIHHAVIWQSPKFVQYLLEIGADPTICQKWPSGKTVGNAYELSEKLLNKPAFNNPQGREVMAILDNHQSNNSRQGTQKSCAPA
jgi:ankyrin repeat protein